MEAQGSGNVITSSRDDYFLNKCSDRYTVATEPLFYSLQVILMDSGLRIL
jgi:hypothetical protein